MDHYSAQPYKARRLRTSGDPESANSSALIGVDAISGKIVIHPFTSQLGGPFTDAMATVSDYPQGSSTLIPLSSSFSTSFGHFLSYGSNEPIEHQTSFVSSILSHHRLLIMKTSRRNP
ncbi:hypothetical protein GX50_03497 [[Emmonsia] crescens]|uniref:Uncharacterized protein n=1 Tax=[Emmonsia] crescens TaxID=73230 RepID=A0A2B7ZK17_9EURO|nr:hypothetical protein GX50_03497 [Emmonsia crescens]